MKSEPTVKASQWATIAGLVLAAIAALLLVGHLAVDLVTTNVDPKDHVVEAIYENGRETEGVRLVDVLYNTPYDTRVSPVGVITLEPGLPIVEEHRAVEAVEEWFDEIRYRYPLAVFTVIVESDDGEQLLKLTG
jgi:hypothetical protein